jgi:uncharacterized protein (TIGR02284 family)
MQPSSAEPWQETTAVSLDSQHLCNALIRRSIELRTLYRHAAAQVSEPGLRTVLHEEALSLAEVITALQTQLRSHAIAPATRSRFIERTRQRLDALLLRGMPRSDDTWIRLLARHEGSLLLAFERALNHIAPDEMTATLHRQLARLQSIHLDMHSLAKAVGH